MLTHVSSETSVSSRRTTWRHTHPKSALHTDRCRNRKSNDPIYSLRRSGGWFGVRLASLSSYSKVSLLECDACSLVVSDVSVEPYASTLSVS
jgi:hypothetical protein